MYEYERNNLHVLIVIIHWQYYTSYPDIKIYFHEVCLDSVDHTILEFWRLLFLFIVCQCLDHPDTILAV